MKKFLEALLEFLTRLKERRSSPSKSKTVERPWMKIAKSAYGWHEVRDYTKLKRWMKAAGNRDWRKVPWCGAYVAAVMLKYDRSITIPKKFLGAREWLKFGVKCQPQVGSILVFWRVSRSGWKGHVGFYVGEDKTHYHVLGGNQSNGVTVSRILKKRLLGARYPKGVRQSGRIIERSPSNLKVTTNEA